ncbi:hypothetical protein BT69DRAFT_1233764, partial [Atractiella rhizophila]
KEGDYAWLSTKNLRLRRPSRKLDDLWIGPFRINEVVSPVAFRLGLPDSMSRIHPVFHSSLLKPWLSDTTPSAISSQEEEQEVQQILEVRGNKYLVHWAGEHHSEATWEPKENLTNCKELLDEFWARGKREKEGKRQETTCVVSLGTSRGRFGLRRGEGVIRIT